MENMLLQTLFIIGISFFIIIIILLIRKKSLMLKYTLLWLFSSIVMLLASIFPGILAFISEKLGFQVASNALFSLILGFSLLILLSLTSIVSKQTQRIITLIQANALLEKRVRELEEEL